MVELVLNIQKALESIPSTHTHTHTHTHKTYEMIEKPITML
jgi:hypothetical protein